MKNIFTRVLLLLFLAVWSAILWTVLIYKLINDGGSFFRFFTNWNWILQTLFFTFEFFANAFLSRNLSMFDLTLFLWFVWGTTMLVFWLVFLMFHDNPQFILNMMTIFGGPYASWVVLDANAVFHVLIAFSMLVYAFIQKKQILDSVYPAVYRKALSKHRKSKTDDGETWDESENYPQCDIACGCCHSTISVPFLLYVFLGPLALIGIYSLICNIQMTYGITTNLWLVSLFAILIVFIFSVLPVIVIMQIFKRPKTSIYKNSEQSAMFHVIRFIFCVPK